jgi:mRNA-degrading endonuclease RelE of RelBE toxin-antitoxin system
LYKFVYRLAFTATFRRQLSRLRKKDASRIADAIEQQLAVSPRGPSPIVKIIVGLDPAWEGDEPFWQLRVGDHRVFYDVDEDRKTVALRAVGFKGRRTTEELVDEIRKRK